MPRQDALQHLVQGQQDGTDLDTHGPELLAQHPGDLGIGRDRGGDQIELEPDPVPARRPSGFVEQLSGAVAVEVGHARVAVVGPGNGGRIEAESGRAIAVERPPQDVVAVDRPVDRLAHPQVRQGPAAQVEPAIDAGIAHRMAHPHPAVLLQAGDQAQGRADNREVDPSRQEHLGDALRITGERIDEAVEPGAGPVEGAVGNEHDALAAHPLPQLERSGADRLTLSFLLPGAREVAGEDVAARPGEVGEERRPGLLQPDHHRRPVRALDPIDPPRRLGEEAGLGDQVLQGPDDVAGREGGAVVPAHTVAQAEGVDEACRVHRPTLRQVRKETGVGIEAHQVAVEVLRQEEGGLVAVRSGDQAPGLIGQDHPQLAASALDRPQGDGAAQPPAEGDQEDRQKRDTEPPCRGTDLHRCLKRPVRHTKA